MKAYIHSFESFSTQDGPGIRYVLFMQGCLAKCLYCQNPDTWPLKEGNLFTASEVFEKIEKCLPYIKCSNGGVTVSGGEPLLQIDFLIKLFKLCKEKDIHTLIDTSAFYVKNKKIDKLIKLTDIFAVDLKAIDSKLHKKITGRDIKEVFSFIEMLEEKKHPYYIRYVLVPTLNDSEKHILKLKKFVSNLNHCERIEVLPYHRLGVHKWKELKLKYKLEKIPPASPRQVKKIKKALGNLH